MKKVKVFFVAAALVLVTAGVFAGKSRFAGGPATDIYYLVGTTYTTLSTSVGGTNNLAYSTTAITDQASFNPNQTGFTADYKLFYNDGAVPTSHYYPVYFQ